MYFNLYIHTKHFLYALIHSGVCHWGIVQLLKTAYYHVNYFLIYYLELLSFMFPISFSLNIFLQNRQYETYLLNVFFLKWRWTQCPQERQFWNIQMLEVMLCFKRIKREMPYIEFVEYEKQEKLSYFLF